MENPSMSFVHLAIRQNRATSSPKYVAIALMIVVTATGMAHAENWVLTEKVRIDKFDLRTEAGSRALFQQLSSASRHVCGVGDSRELSEVASAATCYKQTLGNAVQAVQNERVTQLYHAKIPTG
jgi:UrcA family protein